MPKKVINFSSKQLREIIAIVCLRNVLCLLSIFPIRYVIDWSASFLRLETGVFASYEDADKSIPWFFFILPFECARYPLKVYRESSTGTRLTLGHCLVIFNPAEGLVWSTSLFTSGVNCFYLPRSRFRKHKALKTECK